MVALLRFVWLLYCCIVSYFLLGCFVALFGLYASFFVSLSFFSFVSLAHASTWIFGSVFVGFSFIYFAFDSLVGASGLFLSFVPLFLLFSLRLLTAHPLHSTRLLHLV